MSKALKNVYQFKVTLKDIRPPIWRRIQVPQDFTFWDLHVAIQDAMGWLDYHLHAFHMVNPRTGFKEEIGTPDEDFGWDDDKIHAGWERKISRYFTSENNKALYTYDFGDDWRHEVKLEKILPRHKEVKYPLCVTGKRACPPEDCGGVWGYADLLEVLKDPEHEEYEATVEWAGEDFDPEKFEIAEVVFSDPKVRWDYAFSEEDDLTEDVLDEDEEADGQLRWLSRDHMHKIWQKAKNHDLDGLAPEEKHLGEIMLDHQDEFFNDFEYSDVTYDHVYDPETDVNPFLHIYIHSAVENQLAEKEPIEVFQFYNSMRKKECSHHEAVHLIGAILAPMIFSVVRQRQPFDLDTYKQLLRKHKKQRPEKIFDRLEKESKIYPLDS